MVHPCVGSDGGVGMDDILVGIYLLCKGKIMDCVKKVFGGKKI